MPPGDANAACLGGVDAQGFRHFKGCPKMAGLEWENPRKYGKSWKNLGINGKYLWNINIIDIDNGNIWRFLGMGIPQYGWFIRDNPI